MEQVTFGPVVPLNRGLMIKALSAVRDLSLFRSRFVAGGSPDQAAQLQNSDRLDVRIVGRDCTPQTWPNFVGSYLHGYSAKLVLRHVSADRR